LLIKCSGPGCKTTYVQSVTIDDNKERDGDYDSNNIKNNGDSG